MTEGHLVLKMGAAARQPQASAPAASEEAFAYLQHRDQMLKRVEALRQEALSAQACFHEEHQRLKVALEAVVEQQQLLHELGASPTSLLPRVGLLRPSIKRNAVAPVVVRDANVGAKQRRRADSDLDDSTSTSSSTSAINSAISSDVNQPHTDQEDAARIARMTDVSAPRDQALELHSSEATTMRNLASDSSSSTIGDDGGADPSMTAVTPTLRRTAERHSGQQGRSQSTFAHRLTSTRS
jgi:hypothetical protein